MILLSINFVLLTMLKVREEQNVFWFCWCFPPTGPMHLISALSLRAGTLRAKNEGVWQLPDSTKWRTLIYEHKHTGDIGHSGNHYPKKLEDVNYINNNNYYNPSQQNQGWNQQRPNYSEAIKDALSSRSPSAWWTSQKHSATLAPVSILYPGEAIPEDLGSGHPR